MDKPKIGLKFNPVPKTKKIRTSTTPKKLTKLIYAVCNKDKETGEFKATIIVVGDPHRTVLKVPFTLDSYDLKGKERVFSIKPDNMGKIVCYIRSHTEAMRSGHKSKVVTPFAEDWVYSGYLVRIGKQNYFQIKEAVWHKEFFRESLEVNAKDIHI